MEISNDGKMPVRYIGYFEGEEHFGFVEKEEVRFWYLTDIFVIEGKEYEYIFSIGDYLIYLSAGIYALTWLFLGICVIKELVK